MKKEIIECLSNGKQFIKVLGFYNNFIESLNQLLHNFKGE
jgi:hypothetical protein